jgi:sec-independent protein translocase protein TatB
MGLLFGRLQRYVSDVKADISREMELDELRKLQKQVQGAAQEFKTSVESAAQNVQQGVRSVEDQLNATATEATVAAAPAVPPPDLALHAGDPGGAPGTSSSANSADPPRQPSLPGFDKI